MRERLPAQRQPPPVNEPLAYPPPQEYRPLPPLQPEQQFPLVGGDPLPAPVPGQPPAVYHIQVNDNRQYTIGNTHLEHRELHTTRMSLRSGLGQVVRIVVMVFLILLVLAFLLDVASQQAQPRIEFLP